MEGSAAEEYPRNQGSEEMWSTLRNDIKAVPFVLDILKELIQASAIYSVKQFIARGVCARSDRAAGSVNGVGARAVYARVGHGQSTSFHRRSPVRMW